MRVLLIDTCGEVGLIALSDGLSLLGETRLPAREASSTLIDTIASLLHENTCSVAELDAVGVVAGPGSFTGVRVGMAAAKGLAEAAGVRLVSVSRLAALARSDDVCVALDAGRGEYYVRTPNGTELLTTKDELRELVADMPLHVCDQKTFTALEQLKPEFVEMSLGFALPLVMAALKDVPTDAALADANYVRREQDIYGKKLQS